MKGRQCRPFLILPEPSAGLRWADAVLCKPINQNIAEADGQASGQVEAGSVLQVKVQVGFRTVPGMAAVADGLAGGDLVARPDQNLALDQVGIEAEFLLRVLNDHVIAGKVAREDIHDAITHPRRIGDPIFDLDYRACRRRQNRCAVCVIVFEPRAGSAVAHVLRTRDDAIVGVALGDQAPGVRGCRAGATVVDQPFASKRQAVAGLILILLREVFCARAAQIQPSVANGLGDDLQ